MYRFIAGDFRDFIKACPKDEFSLPNIGMLINAITGHSMFSFVDDLWLQ